MSVDYQKGFWSAVVKRIVKKSRLLLVSHYRPESFLPFVRKDSEAVSPLFADYAPPTENIY